MPPDFLDHPGPLAFAHRGGAAHAPENSWRAFEHAVSLGYTYLETDVQATADGALIAFHDRTLARVTGQPGRVCRMTLREVTHALIGGTEPIPLLEDLLTAWPGVRFNIDVKDAPAILPLAGVLRRTSAWDRVCVVSFSATRLRAARRALDRPVCMAASPYAAAVVRLGGPRRRGAGPAPGSPGPPGPRRLRAAAVLHGGDPPGGHGSGETGRPVPGGAGAPPRFLTEWLARTGVRCVQVPAPVATHSLLHRAHALGLHVHAWTVNDRRTMEKLLDLGVDGIMTDRTVELRDVLAARGQWHPARRP
jgi:glycerophosphoryl diester phosphodiesterase